MKNNRSNNTRSGRKNTGNSKLERVYYIVIGILLIVLLGLVIFIFANRGSNTDTISEDPTPGSEIATETDEQEDEPADEEQDDTTIDEEDQETETESEEDTEETSETDGENTERDQDEDLEPDVDEEETDQEEYEVTEDAPLDESYVPNYGEGSADRNAISQATSSVTGISQGDMTTWWVGNDGPGQVFTVVSDSNQSNVYRVSLQYGDGQWHVTNVQELSSVPSEYQ